MRIDLHMHSTASDGAWPPEAVVRGAAKGGLDVIALTDHDTVAGFSRAAAVGREVDVQVVPGIEVSSTYEGRDVHVLGYFVDPEAPPLQAHAKRAAGRRSERMREMLAKLDEQGVHIGYEDVEEAAGPDRVVIGRPHLAKALVKAGYVASISAAFDTLIGDGHRAFVPTHLLEPTEAVDVVLESGGVPIWAHPPSDLVDPLLPALKRAGLRGLEVYRPTHRRSDVLRLETICKSAGLLISGGSDWHGPEGGAALGDFYVTGDEVAELLEVGGI